MYLAKAQQIYTKTMIRLHSRDRLFANNKTK